MKNFVLLCRGILFPFIYFLYSFTCLSSSYWQVVCLDVCKMRKYNKRNDSQTVFLSFSLMTIMSIRTTTTMTTLPSDDDYKAREPWMAKKFFSFFFVTFVGFDSTRLVSILLQKTYFFSIIIIFTMRNFYMKVTFMPQTLLNWKLNIRKSSGYTWAKTK